MSSAVVRNAFRTELVAAFPAVPYFETLAMRVDNNALPDLWHSTDFIPISDDAISIGTPACRRERGTFRVYVVGKTGAGDTAVIAQADLVAAHFRAWRDIASQIAVRSAIPPAPSELSDGRWLICAVDFAFSRDHYT